MSNDIEEGEANKTVSFKQIRENENETLKEDILKILVAEDEVLLAKAIVKILKLNGYIAEAVYNGLDALNYIESGEYDMAILDVMMPKMDGMTVIVETRKKGLQIPILLLTARTEIQDKVAGLDSGANYYMTKPFDTKELLAVIRSLEKNQVTEEVKLSCGNIILDRNEMELSSPTGSYRLSKKEYMVMEMLIMSFGHGIRKKRILEKLWKTETGAANEIVTIYISYLGNKLRALHATVKIHLQGNEYFLKEVGDDI